MLPVALQQAINMGVNMMDTMMLGSFGEIQLSASSLANQYYNFFTILCMGIIGGSSVLAAQYWGAGEKEKVRETFNMALRLSAGVAVLFMILTWIFPGPIMSIYTSEEEVIVQGIRYLKITAFIFVSQLSFHFWKIWNAQNGDCRSGAGNAHCQRSGVYYHLFLYPCEG